MTQPTTIDLSQLPPPNLIEALDAESYVTAAVADFRAHWPEYDALLLSDPVQKLIRVLAYRETLLRNRVNAAARSVLIAYAGADDLDHLGALFGVERLTVSPANGSTAAVREDDQSFRRRIQLAPEAFSVAGPAGAYEFHALTFDSSIVDAHAWSPREGEVCVAVSGLAGGDVGDDILAGLVDMFARDDIRPLTDVVSVRRAEQVVVDVAGTLVIPRGPDPGVIIDHAQSAVRAHGVERGRIGYALYKLGVAAALKVGGVVTVRLASPASDIICAEHQIPVIGAISLAAEVV